MRWSVVALLHTIAIADPAKTAAARSSRRSTQAVQARWALSDASGASGEVRKKSPTIDVADRLVAVIQQGDLVLVQFSLVVRPAFVEILYFRLELTGPLRQILQVNQQ